MVEHYLNYINHYLQTHAYLGALFTFVVALAESLPLIGTIIPGSITMTVIGILAGRGMLPLLPIIGWATIGALMGDTIGFWIGKYYNERLRLFWPFKKHPRWLELSEAFFARHGGKSIVIGRFVGPARSSVPLIAGLLKMSWPRFFIASVPSAFLWAVVYMLPGVLIGAISLELPHGMTTRFMVIGLVSIVLIWLVFWAIQRFFVFLANSISRSIDKLWNWLNRHHSSRFLIRLITNQQHPEDHHQLTLVLLAFVCLICFVIIFINVFTHGPLTLLNNPLFQFLQSIRTIRGDKFFTIITLLGETPVIALFSLLTCVCFGIKKQWRACCHVLIAFLVTAITVHFFKSIYHSPRPLGFLKLDPSSSFPSGHTALTAAMISVISVLAVQPLDKRWRWPIYTFGGVIIFLVGFSRLYLGAHWLTDVFASLFLGIAIFLLTITSYRRRFSPLVKGAWPYLFILLALLIPWASMSIIKFNKRYHDYMRIWPTREIAYRAWWQDPTQFLPIYRPNRFGEPIQPFNLQWAANLDDIQQNLEAHGWVVLPEKISLKRALSRFGNDNPERHLPLFQPLYRHQPPVILMIKHAFNDSNIIELRLWQSEIRFADRAVPLWIGTINYHISVVTKKSKKPLLITLSHSGGIEQLIQDLPKMQYKLIRINTLMQPKKVLPLQWDGTIIIIGNR